MTARVVLVLAVACLLAASGTGAVATDIGASLSASAPAPAHDEAVPQVSVDDDRLGQTELTPSLQALPETDATELQIRVFENGSAEWAQTVRMSLDSDQAETDFTAFREEFEANRSAFLSDYRTRLQGVVSEASTATNRQMSATGFETEIGTEEVPREWGYVTYRFRWDGFAPAENDTLSVGDVFEGEYFLAEGDFLVISGPDGYDVGTVEPEPDQRDETTLQWDGRRSLRPNVTFVPPDSSSNGTPDGGPPDDGSPGDGGDSMPLGSLLLGAAGLTVLLGGGVLYARRRRESGWTPVDLLSAGTTGGETGPATDADAGTDDDQGRSGDGSADAGEDGTADLMTDEDRVVAALEAEDGRMRQSALADDLGWSASKTSRVLSDMADEDRVEKLRIGRENVIDLLEDGDS